MDVGRQLRGENPNFAKLTGYLCLGTNPEVADDIASNYPTTKT